MVNRKLFSTGGGVSQKVSKGHKVVKNEGGGSAFAMKDKEALAQYAVTGTFNNVYYATGASQLEKVKDLCNKVDSVFIAKLAIYSRHAAHMKDMPAYLMAILHARGENELLKVVFPQVIGSGKMLSNFVQIVRSGATGRKSFGTATKRLIQDWFESRDGLALFNANIGLSNPSLEDILKMTHPSPGDKEHDSIYSYLTKSDGWNTAAKYNRLPNDVMLFEQWKRGEGKGYELPNVSFRALTNLDLSKEDWKSIALNMTWQQLRQNLNMLERRGVFSDSSLVDQVARKLVNESDIARSHVLPYQLFSAYKNVDNSVPSKIKNALQDAAEIATANVPSFNSHNIVVAVDVSGSMESLVTGASNSTIRCLDVAGLVASCVIRQNNDARVLLFDWSGGGYSRYHANGCWDANLNPRDSIMTNTSVISNVQGGGTDVSLPLKKMNQERYKSDLVIYVSDNQSWRGRKFGAASEWQTFKNRNKKAKLVLIDIQPYANTQVPDQKDVLNIGGFNDSVWTTIYNFVRGDSVKFVDEIERLDF